MPLYLHFKQFIKSEIPFFPKKQKLREKSFSSDNIHIMVYFIYVYKYIYTERHGMCLHTCLEETYLCIFHTKNPSL